MKTLIFAGLVYAGFGDNEYNSQVCNAVMQVRVE